MIDEIERFIRYLQLRQSSTTIYRKNWQIRSFYKYLHYHEKQYNEATKSDIEKYLRSLSCTPKVKRQICSVIREFYDFIKHPNNPAKDITFLPDKSKKLFQVPSQPAIERIIKKLSEEDTILALRDRVMIELAYGSGIRRDELRKIDIEDLDLEQCTLIVSGKGNKQRIVPLTKKAVTAAREYLIKRQAYHGPLFVSFTGKRLTVDAVYKILTRKAGIRPHLLRHACATHMIKNGCSVRIIQELLGHNTLTSTQVYTHINKEDLKQKIEKLHPRAICGI